MATPKKNADAAIIAAPAVHTPSKAKYVTVASKLPMSIEIQLCKPSTRTSTGQYGSVVETVQVKTGAVHVIRGTGYPRGEAPEGFPERPQMIKDAGGGYALTPNIPADFWAAWLEQNAETDMVRNGIVKAQADLDSLAADAKDHAAIDSGLGPLNPKGDRRNPRPANASVTPVQPESRTAA